MQHRHCFGFVLAVILAFAPSMHAQTPPEKLTLNQALQGLLNEMVQDLAATPTGSERDAKRERIIKFAAGMTPRPAIPPEAERFEDRARYAFENAKSVAELLNAAREYTKAINAAPWIAGYYFDKCIILEKANKLVPAIRDCKWYLVTAPDATDAREVHRRIAGLDYALERRRESLSHRGKAGGVCTDSERNETGAKVANIGGQKVSAKLISAIYDGTPRNQVMIMTIDPTKGIRLNLDPVYKTGMTLGDNGSYDVAISGNGEIKVWRNGQVVIVTSIDELTQLRNDQLNTGRLLAQGDKTFVSQCQGGPVQGNDGARVAGWLLFPSDCSGQVMGPKPGWLPTRYVEPFGLPTGGFEEPDPDACDQY